MGGKPEPTNFEKDRSPEKIKQEEAIHFKIVSNVLFFYLIVFTRNVYYFGGFLFCFRPPPHN